MKALKESELRYSKAHLWLWYMENGRSPETNNKGLSRQEMVGSGAWSWARTRTVAGVEGTGFWMLLEGGANRMMNGLDPGSEEKKGVKWSFGWSSWRKAVPAAEMEGLGEKQVCERNPELYFIWTG